MKEQKITNLEEPQSKFSFHICNSECFLHYIPVPVQRALHLISPPALHSDPTEAVPSETEGETPKPHSSQTSRGDKGQKDCTCLYTAKAVSILV